MAGSAIAGDSGTCGDDNALLRIDMSMMLMWHASDIIRCDRRRSGLPSARLDMEYDNNRTEGQQQDRGIVL